MKPADIPRMEFRDVNDVNKDMAAERVQLATEAAEKLGYKKLANAIAAPSALLFTLHKFGIDPLWTEKVEAYKDSKRKTGWWTSQKWTAARLLGVVPLVGLASLSFHSGWGSNYPSPHSAYGLASVIAAVVFFFWGCASAGEHHGDRTYTTWESIGIQFYSGNIPEHALAAAVKIKDAIPTVQIGVDYLVEKSEHRDAPKRLVDPFLWAKLSATGEGYYLYVWDEEAEYKF